MKSVRFVATALLASLPFALAAGLRASGDASTQPASTTAPRLVAVKAAQPPALDGRADDAVWRNAPVVTMTANGVMPKTRGTSTPVTLRAAYTDTHLYLIASWNDATKDDQGHRTWKWDAEKKAYVEDTDREDMFAVGFEHTGPFVADMLAGVDATWDLWHWKAFRTNPQGFAMDKLHRYASTQPTGSANKHATKDARDTWIARPQDAGDTVEVQHPAPTEFKGDRVPRYTPGKPSGSTADVNAKGSWADGKWTVEFARRLNTGQSDDTVFDVARAYRLALSVHDRTGEMDKATEAIVLEFRK
jgi:hypothetical protein